MVWSPPEDWCVRRLLAAGKGDSNSSKEIGEGGDVGDECMYLEYVDLAQLWLSIEVSSSES